MKYLISLSSLASLAMAQTVKTATVQPTPAYSGSEMFKEYCAVCHGGLGKGDGPAAAALKKTPANLSELQGLRQEHSSQALA